MGRFFTITIFKNLKKKKNKFSVFESRILNLKKKLESSGFRTIFFSSRKIFTYLVSILNEFINVSFFSLILQLFF